MRAILRWGTCALVLSLTAGASAQKRKPPEPPAPPAAQRLDFDDDKVEGDVQRPDDPLVESRNRSRFGPLIKVRTNFIAELLRSAERH
jgi:hypothetical protein